MTRFTITKNEREDIRSHIENYRSTHNEKELKPNTVSKIISLVNHICRLLNKEPKMITENDIEEICASSKYSKKTQMWINSIMSKYYNIHPNSKIIPTSNGYIKNWLNKDILFAILQSMYDDILNSNGDIPSMISILLTLITCQRMHRVLMLSYDDISNLINEKSIIKEYYVFAILPHLNTIIINGMNVYELLHYFFKLTKKEQLKLSISRKFLKTNSIIRDRGVGFYEFYKFSKQLLEEYINILHKNQHHGIKLLELEKTGFQTSKEYITFLINSIS